MNILFLGDIVGKSGRDAVVSHVPRLREEHSLDAVIVNGENSAGGFGITERICDDLLEAGVDAITLGNHAFDQKEALVFIERVPQLIRPYNYPEGTPGRGSQLITLKNGARIFVINIMGTIHMNPQLTCAFQTIDKALNEAPLGEVSDAVIVDIHAEATSEKQALGHYLDGRASLVVGTHTHTPTADTKILKNGTAYQTDAGMCGDYDSVIGMDKQEPIQRFISRIPQSRFEPASGAASLSGVLVQTNERGLAIKAERFFQSPLNSD